MLESNFIRFFAACFSKFLFWETREIKGTVAPNLPNEGDGGLFMIQVYEKQNAHSMLVHTHQKCVCGSHSLCQVFLLMDA